MASLAQVDYPRDRWQLVIVNNFCIGHDLASYIRSRWTQQPRLPKTDVRVQNPNLGFAGGHNVAFGLSRSFAPDFIYLLNADAHVEPTFLSRIVEHAKRHPKAAIVQSRIMLNQQPELLNSSGNAMHFLGFGYSLGYRQRPDTDDDRLSMFYASGAGMLVRTSVLDKINGLFDRSYFMYHEDLDLSWRARLAGYDIGYAPDSVIFHRYEFSRSIQKFYWMERNRHLTNLVCYRWRTILLLLPVSLVMELGTLLFALRSGWAKEKMRAWAHLLKPSTWKWITSRRRLIRMIRVATDQEMLARMVGVIVNQEIDRPLLTRLVNPFFDLAFRVLKFLVRW